MEIRIEGRRPVSYEEYVLSGSVLRDLSLAETPARYSPPPALIEPQEPSTIPESTQAVVKMLLSSVVASVVRPALRAQTRDEFLSVVRAHWHEFFETTTALHVVVARAGSEERAAFVADSVAQRGIASLVRAARDLSGEAAAGEARFCAETYLRALRIIPALEGATLPPATAKEDRAHAFRFASAAAMHLFGILAIHEAGRGADAEPSGIRGAFELLRAGALDSYVAVRSAMALRHPEPIDDESEEPFDTEPLDHALASIDDD